MTALLTPLMLTLGPSALLLVMGVVFAETGLLLGFFLPGDSLLFLAGALVAAHVIQLPVWLVVLGVFTAAVAGDQLGYLIGRRTGPSLLARPNSRFFRREYAERAQEFFDRHGHTAVIGARFIPVVRTFLPVVAGVVDMPRRRFTAYNIVGALLWGVGIVIIGFLFGGIPFVATHIEIITIGLASVSVVPAMLTFGRQRGAGSGTATPDTRTPSTPEPRPTTTAGCSATGRARR